MELFPKLTQRNTTTYYRSKKSKIICDSSELFSGISKLCPTPSIIFCSEFSSCYSANKIYIVINAGTLLGDVLSSELKSILVETIKEEYQNKRTDIEKRLDRYAALLLKIARQKRYDLSVWVGGDETHWCTENDLVLLEKAKLIQGKMKYTEHNAYCEYVLTKKGTELVRLLKENNQHKTLLIPPQ